MGNCTAVKLQLFQMKLQRLKVTTTLYQLSRMAKTNTSTMDGMKGKRIRVQALIRIIE